MLSYDIIMKEPQHRCQGTQFKFNINILNQNSDKRHTFGIHTGLPASQILLETK